MKRKVIKNTLIIVNTVIGLLCIKRLKRAEKSNNELKRIVDNEIKRQSKQDAQNKREIERIKDEFSTVYEHMDYLALSGSEAD